MTITRHTNNGFDNSRMIAEGYEIIAVEDYTFADGTTESEIVWGRDATILESDLPY